MSRGITYGLGLLLLAVHTCHAQPQWQLTPREIDSIVNPRTIGGSALEFAHSEVRLDGVCEDDTPVEVSFPFTNRGDDALLITRVAATCGCIKTDYDRAPILSGQTGAVRVTFDPQGHPGTLLRKIFVYTNGSQKSPAVQLTLTGNIGVTVDPWRDYPVRFGRLRARQKSVTFRSVKHDQKSVECIECVNSGDTVLQLSAQDLPPYLRFRTSIPQLAPGARADLIFQLDRSTLPADIPETLVIPLVLEGLDVPAAQRTIQISITHH